MSERESQYEQQLKEYQSNLNQAHEAAEKVRADLSQIREENLSKEKQINDSIHTLKQDYEKLQNEQSTFLLFFSFLQYFNFLLRTTRKNNS